MFARLCVSIVTLLVVVSAAALAQTEVQASPPDATEYFEKHVRPLLAEQCYICHSQGAPVVQGGLYLDTKEGMLRGGKSGAPSIVPGKPEESLLIAAVRHSNKDLKMPPAGQLEARQINSLVEWVRMGAPDPRTGSAPLIAEARYDWEKAHEHWAFRPVRNPELPQVESPEWNSNPIDRFVKSKLDEKGLKPLGHASKLALLRRVSFGLTGLPPTPEAVDDFLGDNSPKAFEKVVDRLMASQQYGEHWGRHWLDVVRYADTAGDAADFPVHDMYRYRDYVIRAFRDDKPFDQFIREQIAGDLLEAADSEDRSQKLIATGYIASSRRFGQRPAREFHLSLDDTIENLSKAMLGLSVGCARCHDHKFDPIPTKDYYALFGIFKSTNYAFVGMEHNQYFENLLPLTPENGESFAMIEKQVRQLGETVRERRIRRGEEATPEAKVAYYEARESLEEVREKMAEVPVAYGVSEGQPQDSEIYVKGDPKTKGPKVPRGFLTILGGQQVPSDYKGSGRDLLADWITDPLNPLAPRVIVNRIWQWHFGKGIVSTSNDFGVRGELPTHPELLDYLTSRFIESGWSVKELNKVILLSRTYQASSGHDESNAIKDASNDYYWRFDRRRLSAEEYRDATLAVSGQLDPTMGGPHAFPPKPSVHSMRYSQHRPFRANIEEYNSNRRTVYQLQQRNQLHPYLAVFDGPDPNVTSPQREVSNTPLQALYSMNNRFVHEQADRLAVRVGMAYPDTEHRLRYTYRLLFGRAPTEEESSWVEEFVSESSKELANEAIPPENRNRMMLAALMRVLLASNEFLYVD